MYISQYLHSLKATEARSLVNHDVSPPHARSGSKIWTWKNDTKVKKKKDLNQKKYHLKVKKNIWNWKKYNLNPKHKICNWKKTPKNKRSNLQLSVSKFSFSSTKLMSEWFSWEVSESYALTFKIFFSLSLLFLFLPVFKGKVKGKMHHIEPETTISSPISHVIVTVIVWVLNKNCLG